MLSQAHANDLSPNTLNSLLLRFIFVNKNRWLLFFSDKTDPYEEDSIYWIIIISNNIIRLCADSVFTRTLKGV